MKNVIFLLCIIFIFISIMSGAVTAADTIQTETSQPYINPSIPNNGCYVGAYLGGGNADNSSTTIEEFNQEMGKNHSIFTRYVNISDSKNPNHWTWAEEVKNNGAMPLFVYDPDTSGLNSINNDDVQYFANKSRDLNITVFIVFGHEMNGNWYSWGQQPELYKDKFAQAAEIFHNTAPKAQMCWVPNQNWGYPWGGTAYGDGYTEYYPEGGAEYNGVYRDYVDWVGINFYDRDYDNNDQIPSDMFIANIKYGKKNDSAPNINFHDIFAIGKNKPMIISEIGAFDATLNSTSQINNTNSWISQIYNATTLQNEFPMLHAINYFHVRKNESNIMNDFRIPINGTYNTLIVNPYFISASDYISPSISSTDPVYNAINVARDKTITITFSEAIKWGTGWIELKKGDGTLIPINTSISGNILTINHVSLLDPGIRYNILLHTNCTTDLAGNPLIGVIKSFNTTNDNTKPTITTIDPANNVINVARNKVIAVTFSEPIKLGTGWIELKKGDGTIIPITTSIIGNVLSIYHSSLLDPGSIFYILLHTNSIRDLSGNPLSGLVYTFNTSIDAITPTITTVDPTNNAINVARDKIITVTFSEPIKLGTGWIELKASNGTVIPITTSINGNNLTINHAALLATGTLYNILLHTGSITDLAGNPITGVIKNFTTSFDTTIPTITSTDPSNGAVNVALNKLITITFNENIKAGTNWIELKNSTGTIIPATTNVSGNILTINHALLAAQITFNILLHTGSITDLAGNPITGVTRSFTTGVNSSPPSSPVKLAFIHHSTGENWLSDSNGGLGIALKNNNYFVSDTNYGWGPDSIGDRTDIGNWWEWFRGPDSTTYLNALYNESGQNCGYSRLSTDPGGENQIVMFKSCFPNSALRGSPDDPVPSIDSNPLRGQSCGSEYHTVANAKGIYIDLLEYFKTRQDKLFIVITAPPLSDSTYADNARAFNNWLVNDWLKDYEYNNVFVFDFYDVLTSNGGNSSTNDLGRATGNHHRFYNGTIQHTTSSHNTNSYPTGDDHPSQAGNLKATGEFLPLLNIAYNQWK